MGKLNYTTAEINNRLAAVPNKIEDAPNDGKSYVRKSKAWSEMPAVPETDSAIDPADPSTTKVPTSKAVTDYVDDKYPIEVEDVPGADQEVTFGNENDTETYVKIGDYGIKVKDIKKLDGSDIIPGVINNLTSDSTTDALSAAQGKALNDKIGDINSVLDAINGEVI